MRRARNEHAGRVEHRRDPVLVHIEAADLVGGSVPVFDGAQHTNIGVFIALELAHHIDQMLQQAGPGDRAFLGYMPHQQGAHIACFRGGNQ